MKKKVCVTDKPQKADDGFIIIKKNDSSIKSQMLKATMAKTTCCRGERA